MSQIMQIKQWLERQKIIKRWAEHKTQRTMGGCKIRKRPEWPYLYGLRPTQQIETHPSIIILLFNCAPDLILRPDKSCNDNWISSCDLFSSQEYKMWAKWSWSSVEKMYRKIEAIFLQAWTRPDPHWCKFSSHTCAAVDAHFSLQLDPCRVFGVKIQNLNYDSSKTETLTIHYYSF